MRVNHDFLLSAIANEMHHSHGGLSGIYAVTLPPLSTLPSWSRASLQQKNKVPLQPDKFRSIACTSKTSRSNDLSPSSGSPTTSDREENVLHVLELYKQKVKYLTNNMDFLKDEHSKILKSLHEEIEQMKYENKELKFKLIISDSNPNSWVGDRVRQDKKESKSAVSGSPTRRTVKAFEDEITVLRDSLAQERGKNRILQDHIDSLESAATSSFLNSNMGEEEEPPSSMEDCYVVINALKSEKEVQQKEIAYLQSKVSKMEGRKNPEGGNFNTSSLPALKPSLQSKVVHRMKRQQVMTKEKHRSEILKDL